MSAPSEADGLLEHLVYEIAKGVSGQTGEVFFRSLVHRLATALDADFVFVGALQTGGERIKTLAAYGDGAEAAAFEFGLAGTPCMNVVQKQFYSYSSGIQQLFPQDLLLAQMGAEGYVGSPMIDTNGRCLGLVFALTRRPLQRAKLAEAVLQVFAIRAATELERKNYEDALAVTNSELEQRIAELTARNGRLEQDNAYLLEEFKADHNHYEMVGDSPRFRQLLDKIRLVAGTSATVLITGETGTGKELAARAIHNLSPRRDRPLVRINCAAISPGLVESELFGHVKGVSTGATERRVGRFEHAHGGTLFLNEVTELPLESQSKLLRVLQEQEFEPVGSNRTVKVDVRVLAATNRNLAETVREGRFRLELYCRLLAVPVDVPPLRERREDIPALAAHFVARLARQFGRRANRIAETTLRQLMAYDWPGNIRELENVLARAVVLSVGEVLDTPLELAPTQSAPEAAAPQSLPQSLKDAERHHIEGVLGSTHWVVEGPKGAAGILQMNPSTLRSLMKRLGIRRPS